MRRFIAVLLVLTVLPLAAQVTVTGEGKKGNPTVRIQNITGNEQIAGKIASDFRCCGWFDVVRSGASDYVITGSAGDNTAELTVANGAGTPMYTVTAKGKGSGMLRDPVKLDAFLAAVFANAEGPISVKTRLGVEKPEEFAAILDIYNRYPICELTIHPRVMRQLYRGQADRAAFAAALPGCRMPVCYNGDVTTAADLHTLEAQYPQLSGIMVGRGIIADPALFREARGGAPAAREELRGYLDDLYHGYSELFGSAGCAVSRMKGHWFYLIHKFEGAEKLEKQLRKVREPWEYEVVVNQIFTLPFRP